MLARLSIVGLLSGVAHAGTVTTVTFGETTPADVIVSDGVEARSTAGFVVYQHGAWAPRPSAPLTRPAVDARPLALAVIGCGSPTPAAHRGLAAATSAARVAYWPLIRDAECRHALPAGLLDAVVFQESRYRTYAVSPAGAGGLAQLMPRTASGLGVVDRFDPESNIDAGARYLRSMLDHYRSVPLAVAAYNAGRGSVDRWGGIPLNGETPEYVQKVLGFYNAAENTGVAAPTLMAVPHAVTLSFGSAGKSAE